MSNVSTGTLELCFFSGSTPSILPTMLGGSAPSQTSGAPYRTESGSRGAAWPSPAHQNDACNRGFGVYSLFPGPGDSPRTLYTPTAKSSHPSSFQDLVGAQKVPEAFFSTKFTFVSNGASEFDSASHPAIEQKVSRSELMPKSYSQIPYSPSGKKSEEQNVNSRKESKAKKLSNDVVIIKTEAEEGNKVQGENMSVVERQSVTEIKSVRSNKERNYGIPQSESEATNVRFGDVLANEPDSTEFKTLNEPQAAEDVTALEIDNLEKEPITSGNEVGLCITNPVDYTNSKEVLENDCNKEKCSINAVGMLRESDGKKQKKTDKFFVKAESVNDICSRLTEKTYVKAKTPEASCKNLTSTSRKLYNEPLKPPQIRTLSLSPQNGGCSRTTPVTFKHTSQQEADPRPQNLHIEVSPLYIKKEPTDFQKNSNSTSFLNPAHLESNFFSPSGLNVLDGQLLSPLPYPGSFQSSNRQKESCLSPLDQNFFSASQAFMSPRPVTESPFLNHSVGISGFGAYKNYPAHPKIGGNYLMSGTDEKIQEEVFLKSMRCLPSREDRQTEDTQIFINSTTAEADAKNKMPESMACSGSSVTPCQVAEVTSASSLLSPNHSNVNPLVVKQEMITSASSSGSSMTASMDRSKESAFMTSGQSTIVSSTVGISSTRQRCQQRLNEIKMPSDNVPSPPIMHSRSVQSPASIDLPPAMGAAVFAGSMMDDRSANLVTTWPAQNHNPTLWQYSAPVDYPPFPPVGLQLVRDPITGHFLLIPASNLEALQRAILWPSYQTTPPQMIIPPLSVQPSTPHLLLDTNVPAVDFLTSETIHHSAPPHKILITSDNSSKRKITTPTVIKLETSDCPNAVVVTTCDRNNIYSKTQPPTLSPRRGAVFHSQRTSTSVEAGRRSQATSPCLTPVLENLSNQSDSRDSDSCQLQRTTTVTLQDASNQTDLPFETENEECTLSTVGKDKFIPYTKTTRQNIKMTKTQDVGTETIFIREPEDDKRTVLREIRKKREAERSLSISFTDVPEHLDIKKEIVSPTQVDISGLELLSNSIEQFVCDANCNKDDARTKNNVKICVSDEERKDLSSDACEGAVLLQNLRNGFKEVDENETYENRTAKNLGGLGLLCALAEQRFQEEIGNEIKKSEDFDLDKRDEESIIENNQKILISDPDCHKEKNVKDCDVESNYLNGSDDLPKLKKEVETINDEDRTSKVDKKVISEKEYKKNEEEAVSSTPDGEKNIVKRGPGRPRKYKNITNDNSVLKSYFPSSSNHNSKEMSPPVLEKETDFSYNEKADFLQDSVTMNSKEDIMKPPKLTPSTILNPIVKTTEGSIELTSCQVSLIPVKISNDKVKQNSKNEESDAREIEVRKRKLSEDDLCSSSKKRKVGRPRKHHILHQSSTTETIVAKKPKTKPYLFQPIQTSDNLNCLKTNNNEDVAPEKTEKSKNSYVTFDTDAGNDSESAEDEEKKLKKIRPKLKAEPKVKEVTTTQHEERKSVKKEEGSKQKIKIPKKVDADGKKLKENIEMNGSKESTLPSCLLTTEHLKSDKFPIRTLTVMGGLFYAGQLSAIRAPDVYGITIDGERGNRPHIYSREEILKDSILEVKLEKTGDLLPGTRCCAYWSEQYRCLYPGIVSASVSPDPELDDKFVNVEFDDGDSGKINIYDIRLLPENYPIVEYDPNPLQSLSKRKRRISGASVESHSKERKSIDFLPSLEKAESANDKVSVKAESLNEGTETKKLNQVYEPGSFLSLESERRHLKKKRREKLKRLQSLSIEGKKKHKKHKCSDEHRHHRHHKKHKKHKHKHGKRHGGEMNGEGKGKDVREEEVSGKDKEEKSMKKKFKNKCKSAENSCKLSEKSKAIKPKKCKKRTESVESRSKMAAFLPARQLWGWSGKGFRRPGAKGRARKEFYKTIQRGKERISIGDCAVFLSTGRPDRPYIGRIESMWESWGTNMIVRVKWFYHPEETVGCPATLEYPGALFESPHVDENDVQTISHKCEVLPLKEYTAKLGNDPHRYETIYDNNDIYYLAGYYDPTNTTLKMEPGVK